jgi:alanyl-tRNA synthetase
VLPAAAGRGYVLRRIIRRALRYANTISVHGGDASGSGSGLGGSGVARPVLCELVPALVASQSALLPHLAARADVVASVLRAEEEAFIATLRRGERLLGDALRAAGARAPITAAGEGASAGASGSSGADTGGSANASVSGGSAPLVQLPASVVHELYDRFGFPVDLTALIAKERGAAFDQAAVDGAVFVGLRFVVCVVLL